MPKRKGPKPRIRRRTPITTGAIVPYYNPEAHCGYDTLNGPCLALKGEGTDHQGEDYCIEHDGLPRPLAPRSNKSAMKTISSPKFQAIQNRVRRNTHDPTDLEGELVAIRSLTIHFIESHPTLRHVEDVESAAELLEKVGKMVERIHRMKMAEMVSLETFNLVCARMAEVVLRCVKDDRLVSKIKSGWDRIKITGSDVRKVNAPIEGEEIPEESLEVEPNG